MGQLILELDQEAGVKQQHHVIGAAAAQRLGLRRPSWHPADRRRSVRVAFALCTDPLAIGRAKQRAPLAPALPRVRRKLPFDVFFDAADHMSNPPNTLVRELRGGGINVRWA
jgi:hypothetical protein